MWQRGNKADEVELGTKSSTFMWTLRITKEVLAYKLAACTLDLDEVSPHPQNECFALLLAAFRDGDAKENRFRLAVLNRIQVAN